MQHIKAVLPGLKTRISSALVSVAKEHASYGEITESKVFFLLIKYSNLPSVYIGNNTGLDKVLYFDIFFIMIYRLAWELFF